MIGCGSFARQFHGPAQQRCAAEDPELELVACCDVEANRAREYGRSFGYKRHYTDLLAMLAAERPDAVVLAVPPEITCAAASLVLAQEFPLLLEKPPGISSEELAKLIEAAEMGRARAQVGFNRRYMPVMQRAREIIDGAFAATPVGRINYEMLRFDRWDRDFSTTAVHAIDAVRFLAGSPFRTAHLDYQPLVGNGREATGVTIDLECVSGARVRVEIQPVAGCNSESVKLHALGQSLMIRIPFPGRSMGDGRLEHWRGDEFVAAFSDPGSDALEKMGIVAEMKAFLAAVRSGTAPSPGLQDCRQQVAWMEAMRRRVAELDFLHTA